jgi:uracil-DNA glycosylase
MDASAEIKKREALFNLAKEIGANSDCWLFPTEKEVRGFLGTDSIVIVGDQPSKSPWDESHPHRRIYYDTLKKVGASNVHLTDLYKRRGEPSSLKNLLPHQFPKDFPEHLKFFRREIEILKPTRVVALGMLAYKLLRVYVPELNQDLGQMWHFSYVWQSGKSHLYEAHMKRAIWKIQF